MESGCSGCRTNRGAIEELAYPHHDLVAGMLSLISRLGQVDEFQIAMAAAQVTAHGKTLATDRVRSLSPFAIDSGPRLLPEFIIHHDLTR